MLVRIEAPHFVAGVLFDGDRCTRAAPILGWAIGLERDALREEIHRRGWRATIVRQLQHPLLHPLLRTHGEA